MPIAGVVISVKTEETQEAARLLTDVAGVEVHGANDQGQIVAVLESPSIKAMEKLVDSINALPPVLNVGLTYINTEDESPGQNDGGDDKSFSDLRRARRV